MLKTLEEKVDPKHTAVIVIDMQNDWLHEEGKTGKRGGDIASGQAIVPGINSLLTDARSAGASVIFVRFILNELVMSDVWRSRMSQDTAPSNASCLEGTWGAEIYGFTPEPGDYVVDKHRFSAFTGTNLVFALQCRNIKTVVLTGMYTNICVEITAKDAFMSDYYVVVAGDCTSASDQEAQEASLARIDPSSGVVVNSSEIRKVWAKQRSLQTATA